MHLFELEDQPWFPRVIRAYMQDHLRFMGDWSGPAYKGFVEKLKAALERVGQREIVDLCSGGGGPVKIILQMLQAQGTTVTARLTDLYPNTAAYEQLEQESGGTIKGYPSPVNATDVPPALSGFRLVANGFHHFRPEDASKVLADAVTKRQSIAVIEMVSRSALAFVSVGIGVIAVFIATPFVKPFRLSRLLFTYVLPVMPLCVLWDGLVSCLRVYSPDELRKLVSQLDDTTYEWEIGNLPIGPGKATYLIGTPR
jgi:hypothetical protein